MIGVLPASTFPVRDMVNVSALPGVNCWLKEFRKLESVRVTDEPVR